MEDVAYMTGRLVGEVLCPTQHIYLEGWRDDEAYRNTEMTGGLKE